VTIQLVATEEADERPDDQTPPVRPLLTDMAIPTLLDGPPTAAPRDYTFVTAESTWDEPVEECVVVESVSESASPVLWFRGEYLLWFLKDAKYPTLAATTTAGGSDIRPLFGDRVDPRARHGLRFTAGLWLDPQEVLGVEAGGFFLFERAVRFTASSDLTPSIVRPFVDANGEFGPRGGESGPDRVVFVARPGALGGRLAIDAPSSLFGVEANGRARVWGGPEARVDLLGGFRFLGLDEGLSILDERTVFTDPDRRLVGRTISVRDDFDTRNRFYGGQLGAAAQFRCGDWTADVFGKVALGCTQQVVDVRGGTRLTPTLAAFPARPAGLLALDSNDGRATRNRFAVVPEVGVTVGYQLTEAMRVWAGYNLLFWGGVVRPGGEIDTVLDLQRVPELARRSLNQTTRARVVTPPRPALRFNDTGFWAQGLTCGVEVKY
jgi:hypothetical protein